MLLDMTRMVRPALVTPLEVLGDGRATLALKRDFIGRLPQMSLPEETGLLGVVHGRTWGEWLQH